MGESAICWAAVALAATALPQAAFGQQNRERRYERIIREADPAYRLQSDTSLGIAERSLLEYGGFLSFLFINFNDANNNHVRLNQPELTLYGRAVIDGAHSFFGRARFAYRDFSPGDSFDGHGDKWVEPFLDRFWYEFDLRNAIAAYEGRSIEGNVNIRVGRQFVDWGAGLTLSENLYAVRLGAEYGGWALEALAGVTPGDESVIDFDSSRRGYDDDTQRGLFGGKLSFTFPQGQQFYTFLLHQQDYNSDDDSRPPLGTDVEFEYDSTYLGFGFSGSAGPNLLYLGEFVYEFGESQSDPIRGPQEAEDISAWAARGQLTYLLGDQHLTRFELEGIFASGDDDRIVPTNTVGGNRAGTADTAFNSLGYVNTGLAFAPSLNNLMLFRLGASSFPFNNHRSLAQLQLGGDLLLLSKMDSDAPIHEPTENDRFLGVEADLFANYRVTSDLAFTLRYGAFFPSDTIESGAHTRHFILLGVTLSF